MTPHRVKPPLLRVFLNPCDSGWCVRFPHSHKQLEKTFMLKAFAMIYATHTCRKVHDAEDRTVSLNVRDRWGRFQEERTYGLDPARTPG